MDSRVRRKHSPPCCTGKNSAGIPYPVLSPQFNRDFNKMAEVCKVSGQVGQQPAARKTTELTDAGSVSAGEGLN